MHLKFVSNMVSFLVLTYHIVIPYGRVMMQVVYLYVDDGVLGKGFPINRHLFGE